MPFAFGVQSAWAEEAGMAIITPRLAVNRSCRARRFAELQVVPRMA
jgi:hypothetical protein